MLQCVGIVHILWLLHEERPGGFLRVLYSSIQNFQHKGQKPPTTLKENSLDNFGKPVQGLEGIRIQLTAVDLLI